MGKEFSPRDMGHAGDPLQAKPSERNGVAAGSAVDLSEGPFSQANMPRFFASPAPLQFPNCADTHCGNYRPG